MIWAPLRATALVTKSLRTKYPSNRPTTGVSFREWRLDSKTGCMADNPYWDGEVHKAVKFGDPFDTRTVEGRKRAAQRAAHARRAKAEVEALRRRAILEFLGSNSPTIRDQLTHERFRPPGLGGLSVGCHRNVNTETPHSSRARSSAWCIASARLSPAPASDVAKVRHVVALRARTS